MPEHSTYRFKLSSKTSKIAAVLYFIFITTIVAFGLIQEQKPDVFGTSTSNFNEGVVNEVVDGDTIKVTYDNVEYTVRLIGIDTPESVHPTKPVECFAQEAKQKLSELTLHKEVSLQKDKSDTDKYGRLLRYVYINDTFVNAVLVKEGYAFAKEYKPDNTYSETFEELEKTAQLSGLGLWNKQKCNY